METFGQGLLSGIGHPVLGFDHLAFVLLAGVAAALARRALAGPVAYVAAMLVGTLAVALGAALPAVEVMVALSLLVLGGAVMSLRATGGMPVLAMLAGFGLFHGAAFGGSIAGVEAAAGAAVLPARWFWAGDARAVAPRLAGAVVAGMGLLLTLESAEAAVFAVLGWAG